MKTHLYCETCRAYLGWHIDGADVPHVAQARASLAGRDHGEHAAELVREIIRVLPPGHGREDHLEHDVRAGEDPRGRWAAKPPPAEPVDEAAPAEDPAREPAEEPAPEVSVVGPSLAPELAPDAVEPTHDAA